MKILYLLRHAKAVSANHSQDDFQRELDPRGIDNAENLAKQLDHRHSSIDLIVSSSALRTKRTAQIIHHLDRYRHTHLHFDEDMYNCDCDYLLKLIKNTDDAIVHLMLVGHNPSVTELAHFFSPKIAVMGTCHLVLLKFEASHWDEISNSTLKSTDVLVPEI